MDTQTHAHTFMTIPHAIAGNTIRTTHTSPPTYVPACTLAYIHADRDAYIRKYIHIVSMYNMPTYTQYNANK